MNYGQIRQYDVANGTGVRTTIFVTGCYFNCYNCFNKEYQDFQAGKVWTQKETQLVKQYLSQPMIHGLSILGGEPFEHSQALVEILNDIQPQLRYNKDVWIWTGNTIEYLLSHGTIYDKQLLKYCNVLVDGLFIQSQKDLTLKFRGSRNQRIIDVPQTLLTNEVVLYDC